MLKVKKVFSLFLAMDLCKCGHKIVGIELNKEQHKQIYLFEWSEKLEKDFGEIRKQHSNKK